MFDKVWKTFGVNSQTPKKKVPMPTSINKPNNSINRQKQALPADLSAKILDLQIQMQKDQFPKQLVDQLLSAYTEAVQFYEQRSNQKYKLYQKRMKDFLQKPVIYKLLQGEGTITTIKREQSLNQQLKRANYKTKEQVNKILSRTTDMANKQKLKINQSLEQQQSSLQQRMRKRKVMSNYSVVSGQDDQFFDEEPDYNNNNQESFKKEKNKKIENNIFVSNFNFQPRVTNRRKNVGQF